MAGETYGSPGFAFSGAMEDYLLKSEELKHRAFMDNLTLKKELREEAADKADAEIRREQLAATKEDRATKARAAKVKESNDYLENNVAPGDFVDSSIIDKREELGLPTPLGPVPQKPTAGVPPALAEDPSTIANVPAALSMGRPYLGNVQRRAQQGLADVVAKGGDRNAIVAQALRLGVAPKDMGSIVSSDMGPTQRPVAEPSFVAYGPDGKEMPGVVSILNGVPMLNGVPPAQGVTFRRAPAPVDPTLERYRNAEIDRLRTGGGGGKDHYTLQPELDPTTGKPTGRFFGYDTSTNKFTQVQGAQPVGTKAPPGASQTATRINNREDATQQLDQLDAAIDDAKDLVGPGKGQVTTLTQLMGMADPRAQALATKMFMSKVGVDIGMGGGARSASNAALLKQWEKLLGNKFSYEDLKATVKASREMLSIGQKNSGGDSKDTRPSFDDLWNQHVGGKN